MRFVDRPSPNFDERGGVPVDLVVLHYTGMASEAEALARLCDPQPPRVSAHYVVGEDGGAYRLVQDDKRAWHAGVSIWEGRLDTNSRSIGIEIVNGGHDFGLPPYPAIQIAAVIDLLRMVLPAHGLAPSRVVGHSDVAPDRKEDPGELFPWRALAEAGVSIWPEETGGGDFPLDKPGDTGEGVAVLQRELARFGYGVPQTGRYDEATAAAVRAFQRRFLPRRIDGIATPKLHAVLSALNEGRLAFGAGAV